MMEIYNITMANELNLTTVLTDIYPLQDGNTGTYIVDGGIGGDNGDDFLDNGNYLTFYLNSTYSFDNDYTNGVLKNIKMKSDYG